MGLDVIGLVHEILLSEGNLGRLQMVLLDTKRLI